MSKRILTTLSLAQRVEVIRLLDQNETQVSLADKFKVGQAVISRIKRDKERILNDWQNNFNPERKRKRWGQAGDVDEALLQWFSQARSRQLPLNGKLLKEKAIQLATELGVLNFTPSNGWIERWKDRYNISFKKQHRENQDADDVGAENSDSDLLPGMTKDHSPSNNIKADSTGLYWKAIPDSTFSFKTSEVYGAKVLKDVVPVVLDSAMASVGVHNREVVSSFIDKATAGSPDGANASDMQVKEEPEDTGYEQVSASEALSYHSSTTDSTTSSPITSLHSSPALMNDSSHLNESSNIAPQIPLNDLFAGSTIRSQLHGAIAGRKMDTVESIVENLLRKNETLLAMSDAGGLKPNARRARAAHDGFVRKTEPAFPATGQVSVFPVSPALRAHVNVSNNTSHTQHRVIRPKSPTRRYDGMMKDKTHFTHALMESSATDPDIEKIFNVQNHELVCAISSKSLVTDKFNKIVASLEFGYFWCNFCPFSTNNKSLLTQHVLEHRFCCKYCAYESFCRSDIVRHMHTQHQEFKETAARLSYCTFLSDYLRVKARMNEKENEDPVSDAGDIDREEKNTFLHKAGRKHKSEPGMNDCVAPMKIHRAIDEDCSADETSSQDQETKSGENYSIKCLAPPAEADYDIFDMEVEEVIDGQHNGATDETDTFLYSSNFSSPHSCSPAIDKQPGPAGLMQAVPLLKSNSFQALPITYSPNSSKNSCTHQPHGSSNKVHQGTGTSNLYWSCGYCTFHSSGQAEIKDHSSRVHPGKPHRYVALIKSLAEKTSRSATRTANQSHLSFTHSSQVSRDSSHETMDVVSLKETNDSPGLLKVKIKVAKKEIAVFKCYHCLYTSKRHWTMKNHIFHKHRGEGLVALDDESQTGQRVFFCARDDCTFRSDSASAFLSHVDQCTPWSKPKLADVEVEPHIRQCLEQTIAIAEMAKIKI